MFRFIGIFCLLVLLHPTILAAKDPTQNKTSKKGTQVKSTKPKIEFNRPLIGTIGDLPVHMMLECYTGRLSGSYYYTGNRAMIRNWHTDLQLDGKIDDDGHFEMSEMTGDDFTIGEPKEAKKTGNFKGDLKIDGSKDHPEITISGQWISEKGNRVLPFTLSNFNPSSTSSLKLSLKKINEDSKKFNYTIKANYPQIEGSQDPSIISFNKEILSELLKNIKAFKNNVIGAGMYGDKDENSKNTIDIDYEITFSTNSLISVVFYNWEWYTGYVKHDIYSQFTFNYDLEKGKQVAITDLFEPKSGYLTALSAICRPLASRTSFEGDVTTGPSIKNYSSFFLTDKAVVFNYQVDHSLGGFAEIYLPLKEVAKYLNPNINKILSSQNKE